MHGYRTQPKATPGPLEPIEVIVNEIAFRSRPQTADNTEMHPHGSCSGRCLSPLRHGHPHLFQLVELANLGPEDMDDHIARIDQNPVPGILALGFRENAQLGLQILDNMVRDRAT